jgi:hypothetical protein
MVKKTVMQFTDERVVEESAPGQIWLGHIVRYKFACRYIKGRNILDISCGTGYGIKTSLRCGGCKDYRYRYISVRQ